MLLHFAADQTTDLSSMTTGDSAQHIDPDTPDSHGHEGKRSLFGKLKDKTKNVGSKLKSKVGMKKPGGTGAHDEEEYEYEDEEEPAKDVSSNFTSAFLVTATQPGCCNVFTLRTFLPDHVAHLACHSLKTRSHVFASYVIRKTVLEYVFSSIQLFFVQILV